MSIAWDDTVKKPTPFTNSIYLALVLLHMAKRNIGEFIIFLHNALTAGRTCHDITQIDMEQVLRMAMAGFSAMIQFPSADF